MYNKVILIGNLTKDPEVKYLPSGTAITNFRIAVNEKYRDRNQEWREETLFIQIETFSRMAETCAQYLKKGSRVFVDGKLREDSWDAQDGTKRSRMVVRAMTVKFMDSRGSGEGGSYAQPQAQSAQAPRQPQSAAPSAGAQSAPRDVPEVDVNEPVYDSDENDQGTSDDLPF